MMTLEEEHEKFEEWYKTYRKWEQGSGLVIEADPFIGLLVRERGGYLYGHPEGCWQAWRARAVVAITSKD